MVELAPVRPLPASGEPAVAHRTPFARSPRSRAPQLTVLVGLLLGLGACPKLPQGGSGSGGSGGSAGSAGSTGGADDREPSALSARRLDQLSRSDLQQYCQDLNQELITRFDNRRLTTYACTRMYIQNGDSTSCNLGVSDCLLNNTNVSPGAPRPPDFALDNAECDLIGRCRLTLGEFDTCLGDRFEQSEQLIKQATCSLANDPPAVNQLLQKIDNPRALPQSCVGLVGICPELL